MVPFSLYLVHTSWIADRDQQWEHAREFGPDERPNQLLQMGPLPALCVGVDTEEEPRLLYFEHDSGPRRLRGLKKQ